MPEFYCVLRCESENLLETIACSESRGENEVRNNF